MNSFCEDCANARVPLSLKEKFNDTYKRINVVKTFLDCPTKDPKVVGCLMKERLKVDWSTFCVWLNDNKSLTATEAIEMAKLGYFSPTEKRKGKK